MALKLFEGVEPSLEITMTMYDIQQRVKIFEFSVPMVHQLFKLKENTVNILKPHYLRGLPGKDSQNL
ncbi:hypothetical protein NPIL_305401 [Nephila pilipes]|uniref:Uncharacterized protein n=1 Tax=Nephila pilipes TaxID=299642 RepID=A0A8X6NA71_NEPPI|nr:hypothetical protein NPIL_305401 [Nephila pilipes]